MKTKVMLLSLCFLIVIGCSLNSNQLSRSPIIISTAKRSYVSKSEPARMALESTCQILSFNKKTNEHIGNATAVLVSVASYSEGKFLEQYILITAAHTVEPTMTVKKRKNFDKGFIIFSEEVEVYWGLESYQYDYSGKIISTQFTKIKPNLSGVEIIRYESIDIAIIVLDVSEDLIFSTPVLVKNNNGFSTSSFWDKIFVSGCAHGENPLIRQGRINQIGVKHNDPYINSITCSVTNGDSGGGVFNIQGELIGIAGITFDDGVGGGYIPLLLLQRKLNKDRPELAALIWR